VQVVAGAQKENIVIVAIFHLPSSVDFDDVGRAGAGLCFLEMQ
jgi:hypothetical protein